MLAGQLIHDVYIHSLSDSCNNYNLHFVYKQSKLTSLTNKLSIYYYSIGSVVTFCIFVINCEQSLQTVILTEASPLRSLQKNLNGLAQFYFILDAVLEFFKYFQNSYFVEYLCIYQSLPVDRCLYQSTLDMLLSQNENTSWSSIVIFVVPLLLYLSRLSTICNILTDFTFLYLLKTYDVLMFSADMEM